MTKTPRCTYTKHGEINSCKQKTLMIKRMSRGRGVGGGTKDCDPTSPYLTAAIALGPSATLWLRARPAVAGRLGRVAGCCFLMAIPMVSRLWLRPRITRWREGRQGDRHRHDHRHTKGHHERVPRESGGQATRNQRFCRYLPFRPGLEFLLYKWGKTCLKPSDPYPPEDWAYEMHTLYPQFPAILLKSRKGGGGESAMLGKQEEVPGSIPRPSPVKRF